MTCLHCGKFRFSYTTYDIALEMGSNRNESVDEIVCVIVTTSIHPYIAHTLGYEEGGSYQTCYPSEVYQNKKLPTKRNTLTY